MLAQWIADLVGEMHKFKISKSRLAEKLGVTREYVSMVLNGHRAPAGAEVKFRQAVSEIVEEIIDEESMKDRSHGAESRGEINGERSSY